MTALFNRAMIEPSQGARPHGKSTGQEVQKVSDDMTQAELVLFLETLAENIEAKATTAAEAAEIIRKKIEALK